MLDGCGLNPFTTSNQMTLQQVLDAIKTDESLGLQRRRNLLSALRSLSKLLGKDLRLLPAHPRFYRDFFKGLHPEHCGLSESRIRNIRSDLRFALRHTGCIEQGQTYMAGLSEDWQALRDQADAAGFLSRYLSRQMRYCSANGIAPKQVDDNVSERFLEALVEESFIKDPVTTHRNICRLWNRAVNEVPGWPQIELTVPRYKETYTVRLELFPKSFQDEVQAMFDRWSGKDLLDNEAPDKPLKPRTIESRRYRLRQIVSPLVHQGWAIEEITSLSKIVEIETAKTILRFHLDRVGGKTSSQTHSIAVLIKTIAKHWVKVDKDHVNALKVLCKRVEPENIGLTSKNRDRLRQFDDLRNVALLLDFPRRQVEEVRRRDTGRRQDAIDVQIALAVEILLMAPIRAANLVNIEIERHIQRTRTGRKGTVHLVIPGTEVKNGEELEFELPPETVDLLDLYLRKYHPRLTASQIPFLFPGKNDGPKGRELLGDQFSKRVFKVTGLKVNLHFFRHLAAKLYLDQNPGGYEVVRRLLGHRSMESTTRFYAGMETAAVGRHFDKEILKLRRSLCDSEIGESAG